ncbi:MAG TPA: nuclear transport factor 2 family protein [Novosphingobium sp.]|nr:nuclear transport factor 2 family protein [Novosphingobium sp.]
MSDERGAIETVVFKYINGIRDSDPDLVASAFHAQAVMTGHFGGQFMVIPNAGAFVADYMRKAPPTHESSPDFEGRIVRVDQYGTLANVAIEENGLEGHDMRSVFILHKIDGAWLIVQKGTWSPGGGS